MNKIIKPDYDNSTIELIDKALLKGYKNVVLMIFDGMSVDILEKHLPCTSFLRSNMKHQVQ